MLLSKVGIHFSMKDVRKGTLFCTTTGGTQKGKGFGLRGGAFVPLHVAVPLKFFSGV